jgi:ubiquinone/menaquinone biosynthesis C-methylase UbiE
MTESTAPNYALQLSAEELNRYRVMAAAARELEGDLWQRAGLVPGAAVADVGCGPGAMFAALVDCVGPDGRVIGIDGVPTTVAQAHALVEASGWPNVEVQVGKADATAVPPGSLDTVMMRHVLAHNGPSEQAIVDHLASLVKPGGHVYLVDIDGGSFHTRPDDPEVTELNEAYREFHAGQGNDLLTGLRLDDLLTTAGMEVVAYRGWFNIVKPQGRMRPPAWAARDAMVAAGVISADDLSRYEAAMDRVLGQGATIFAPVFGAVGRRPS